MVGGVDEQASLERKATTTNAIGEVLSQPEELVDLDIESISPGRRQRFPIVFSWRSLLRQIVECRPDLFERNPDPLCRTNKGNAAKYLTAKAALIGVISPTRDQTFSLIEVERGDRDPRPRCYLANRPFMKRRR